MDIIKNIVTGFCFFCMFGAIYCLGYYHGCKRTFKITDDYINELEKAEKEAIDLRKDKAYNEKERAYREAIRDIDDLK